MFKHFADFEKHGANGCTALADLAIFLMRSYDY